MQSTEFEHPVHEKILRFLEQLEPLGPTFVHIRLTGNDSHFLRQVTVHSVKVGTAPYSSQHYFPSSTVSSSVIILSKDIPR
ncbi:hypothetical protein WJU16_21695 [Chitinophaga pollutisoli]|uniref:Uncharacterized protein n=1 Tax=Chitinophaga pollutisoli TaxID=3133966 RepID=A0ABZ2YLI5_9BACT